MDGGSPAVEAERYVLSSWMDRADAVWDSLAVMTLSDFVEIRHEILAETIFELAQEGNPTDPIAVVARLHQKHAAESVGVDYVYELHGYAATSMNVTYYAELVHANGRRRALLQAGDVVRQLALDPELGPADALERARAVVDDAAGIDTSGVDETTEDLITQVLANIGKEEPAFQTPWPRLTRTIRGFRRGGMYVIGARPAVGKSAVALQIMTELEHHGFVVFFSLEMPKSEITKRLIAQQTGVSYAMVDGMKQLPDWATDRIAQWREVYPGRMIIEDDSSVTINDVRARVRTLSRKFPIAGVCIDYLQLMGGGIRGQNRVDVVGEISRGGKLMAREFDIPVIMLAQLNRKSEDRADKMPAMSDLRESGAIEQDADSVMLLHRDMSLGLDPRDPAYMNFIIAKNRQGETGLIELDWEGEFMRATGGQL